MERYDHNVTNIPNFRVQAWASVSYYQTEVYPVLRAQGYVPKHDSCHCNFFFFISNQIAVSVQIAILERRLQA